MIALRDIKMQATRHQRATDERPYLITDLEIIERLCDAAIIEQTQTLDAIRLALIDNDPEDALALCDQALGE